MGIFTAYALSTNKLDALEFVYRDINICKKHELMKEVLFKHMLSNYLRGFMEIGDVLEIPCCLPITYIPLFSVRYYWLWHKFNPLWYRYMRAGTNFPLLHLRPSILHGRIAVDGGATDNIPLYSIFRDYKRFVFNEDKPDLIIALHFDARYDYRKYFSSDVPVLELDVSICNDFKKNHTDFSSEYVDEMLSKAEEYGDKICRRLFCGDCSNEGLIKTINEIFLEEHAERQGHTSVDGYVSVLNVLGRALRSDSVRSKDLF